MTQPIDIAFLAAKVAALRDEKAKVLADGASLVYNYDIMIWQKIMRL